MSLENDEQHSLGRPADTSKESQKKSRISFTRDFLLSLSELDVCKKLPPGFDKSILSEFEDTPQDRQRIPGSFSGFRRIEYSSSPPTRGESGNYSRGIHGRWDSRSSGKSDRDSDTQSDRDSDLGRRHGNQSRQSWQGPEHDGLLGSGSFPRPSGFTAGASAPNFRANDQYHLNKSNEPYHPPRPYKAAPHSRRETNDSFNDETFGSTEFTSEDRAEEERKRRASFESWRKEQQKAFQEKKINPERRKDDFDISELLVDSKDDKGHANRSKESDEPIPASNNVSEKLSRPIQIPASRPLVPPGFASSSLEKNFGTKTSMHSHSSQVGSSEIEVKLSESKGSLLFNGISNDLLAKQSKQHEEETLIEQRLESKNIHLVDNNKSTKAPNFSSALDKFNGTISKDSHIYKSSSLSEVFVAPGNIGVTELDSKKLLADKMLSETSQNGSTSILDKIFVSSVIADGGGSTNFTEPNDRNADETCSLDSSHSSKFAHLFLDEEKKSMDDLYPRRPKDLLSLIQGGEKGGSNDRMVTKHVASNFPFQISELADGHVRSNLTSTGIVNSEQSWNINDANNSAAVPAVLTCEDLEKSILSESTENDLSLPPAVERWKIPDAECEKQEVNVNNHASQHLLSLLQNKTSTNTIVSSASHDIRPSERLQTTETATVDMAPCDSIDTNAENASGLGKSLTLEALFGSAFMKELQSVGAPASVQMGSIESARVDVLESNRLPLNAADDSLLPSTDNIGLNRTNFEKNILPFTQREQMNYDIEGHLLGFNGAPSAVDSSHLRAGLGSKLGGFDGSVEIRLPEEDILLGVSSPLELQNFMAGSVKAEIFPSQETPIDAAEKLAALKCVFQDERPVVGGKGPPFLPVPYDMREPDIPFRNQNIQASSPHLHRQLNHGGPLVHSLDSHPSNISSQMKFMAPEGIIHHDAPPNHQFSASMLRPVHRHSSGLMGFDPPIHHPMLQQMQMPRNFPPPNLQRGFPGVAPPPPHSNNQMTGLLPELNPMHGFPMGHGHRQPQPNFAGLGIPPGHDVGGGSHHPEALQSLIEMELRSKSTQMSPFGASGHSQGQGIYGHELDMGFQYR
ncbi:Conserved Binding of eIF4E 1 [Hibiscus trionum]|uniref:Conserved Binding of eIF4E 1 n=1 Tax=Hibiscus trionum TaxID=183268 RepID=A0A9W7LJR9_HIBTR|nr:Conserved Binding of eIF4E 1 [Hibiscus trionum]